MRKLLLFVWLLLPVGAVAYHYGPGQDRLALDQAGAAAERGMEAVREARRIAAEQGDAAARAAWGEAEVALTEALDSLPGGQLALERSLRLERSKAWMFVSKLPEARSELESLVRDMVADPSTDAAQLADARAALGNAQYYTTWLMRLEGAPREEWEPEIESSRQNFTLCAEEAQRGGDEARVRSAQEDLESAVRLARMDLGELQGLPLPSQ